MKSLGSHVAGGSPVVDQGSRQVWAHGGPSLMKSNNVFGFVVVKTVLGLELGVVDL
jgi:hypothetical protein